MKENYDRAKPVCDNQDDFNTALYTAVQENADKNLEKNKPWIVVYGVVWFILMIWGVLLAMKTESGPNRLLHIMFAITFAPLYVIAYYVSGWGGGGGSEASFGFPEGGGCGCSG